MNRYIDEGIAELVPGVLFIDEVLPWRLMIENLLSLVGLFSVSKNMNEAWVYLFAIFRIAKQIKWTTSSIDQHYSDELFDFCGTKW